MPMRFALMTHTWPTGERASEVVDARSPNAPHRARCLHCSAPVLLYTCPDAHSVYIHADAELDKPDRFCPLDARCLHQEK